MSKIITVLSQTKTKFAVRSGGHTLNPGFNAVGSNGVLVVLQYLDQLSISGDKQTITTGPGNRWNAVYALAGQNNLTIVGGREPMVGVAGFLLGGRSFLTSISRTRTNFDAYLGGLSAFYNTVGLGMDNVLRYEVVLTDGTIVNATANHNADLFKALKGGLTNMGIVTAFDLKTYPYYDIYIEIYLYNQTNTPALLTAYANYLSKPNVDPLSQVAVQVTPKFTLGFYGYIGKANRPAIFNEFYKIPVTTTFSPPTNGTFTDLIFGFYGNAVSPGSSYSASLSHKVVSPQFFQDSYQEYLALSANLPPTVSFNYEPQGVTPNLIAAGRAANPGGNLLGLESTPQTWVDIYMDYAYTNETALAQSTVNAWVANMTARAQSQGIYLPYQYVNNAGPGQTPLRNYGAANFQAIRSAAAKWDPNGVMQRLQNGGYLASNEQG